MKHCHEPINYSAHRNVKITHYKNYYYDKDY